MRKSAVSTSSSKPAALLVGAVSKDAHQLGQLPLANNFKSHVVSCSILTLALNGSGGVGGLVATHLRRFCGWVDVIALVVPAETVHPVEAELLVGEAKVAYAWL